MTTKSWQGAYFGGARLARRSFFRGTAAGAAAAALIACGGGGGTTLKFDDAATARQPGTVWLSKNNWKLADETKEAVAGGIYRGAATSDNTINYDAISLMDTQVPFRDHVYELLMGQNRRPGVDPRSRDGNVPIGTLAESMEISEDGATITFTLRPGVKYQNIAPVNGRVMDMADWRSSLERHLAVGVYRSFLIDLLDKPEFPDARHMVWKFKAPYAPLFDRITNTTWAFPIMPKELNADPNLAQTVAIGTGFKILDKRLPSITTEYRKNPEYWGGAPYIDRWHDPIIPEYANRYAQFVRGNITSFTPTAKDILLLHKDAPNAVVVGSEISLRLERFLFGIANPEAQATADPRVRVALRRSIDFKGIGEFRSNRVELEGAGIPVEILPMSHVPREPSYWLNPEQGELGKLSDNYLYDQAEAKKLMAAAGHSQPPRIYIPLDGSSGDASEFDRLVVDSLKATGTFAVDAPLIRGREEHNELRIGRVFDGMVRTSITNELDYFLWRDYSSFYREDRRTAHGSPKTDSLTVAQRQEIDFDKRVGLIKEIQTWFAEWFPSIPGGHDFTTYSFRWPWVRNLNWGTSEAGVPAWGAHRHWLDQAMPGRDKGEA